MTVKRSLPGCTEIPSERASTAAPSRVGGRSNSGRRRPRGIASPLPQGADQQRQAGLGIGHGHHPAGRRGAQQQAGRWSGLGLQPDRRGRLRRLARAGRPEGIQHPAGAVAPGAYAGRRRERQAKQRGAGQGLEGQGTEDRIAAKRAEIGRLGPVEDSEDITTPAQQRAPRTGWKRQQHGSLSALACHKPHGGSTKW
jgi:hypothetical protein